MNDEFSWLNDAAIWCTTCGADIVQALQRRFAELQETVWWSGGNATFFGSDVCATVRANQGFFAPFRETPEWPPV